MGLDIAVSFRFLQTLPAERLDHGNSLRADTLWCDGLEEPVINDGIAAHRETTSP